MAQFILGKSKGGLTNGGLKPQIFRENRGEILPGKSGLFGANWRLFRAGRGLFGADRDQFLCTPQPRGKSRNCPERALFGPIGPFRAKPPFAKPPFGFPRLSLLSEIRELSGKESGTGSGTPFLRGFGNSNLHAKKGFRNQFQTPFPKVREPHFLRFGLPETPTPT